MTTTAVTTQITLVDLPSIIPARDGLQKPAKQLFLKVAQEYSEDDGLPDALQIRDCLQFLTTEEYKSSLPPGQFELEYMGQGYCEL